MFLTKLEVNNQIVRMRHNVRRAKVQTLNKLSRQIKKIKGKNCSSELKMKNEKKISKLLAELLIMKKIKEDEIAAFALANSRNPQEILSNENSGPKLKALSRLSIHKSIEPVVNSFRLKHPDWQSSFPKVLVALKTGKKLKFDFKNLSKELRRQREANECKTGRGVATFTLETKSDASEEESEKDEDCSMSAINSSDSVATSKFNDSASNEGYSNSRDISSSESFSAESDSDKVDNTSSNLMYPRKHTFNKNKNIFEVSKMCDEIQLPHYSCKTEDTLQKETLKKSVQKLPHYSFKSEDILKKETLKKSVSKDPFFVTTEGKEYETIVPVSHVSVENKVKDINIYSETKTHNPPKLKNEKSKCDNKSKMKNNFKKEKYKSFDGGKLNMTTKLHPSWIAKKQQTIIKPFTGKKITFD